jgi:hypothetical protein
MGQRVELELEFGDDAEVAPAAAHPPEEVGVLILAGPDQLAVGGDHVHGLQLIDREPVLAHDPTYSTAEREAGQPGMGDDSRRNGEAELLRLAIELAEQHAGLNTCRSPLGVHSDPFHQPEVDEHAVVAH